jgi:hypothetical protein
MRFTALLFLLTISVVAALPSPALAQGAATGGTRDTGGPTMVFPIRPRTEPGGSTAVPNRTPPPAPPVRLRRAYRHHIHR